MKFFSQSHFFCISLYVSKGGVRGCWRPPVSIFYDPPKVQFDPTPLEKGFLTPSLDFVFLADNGFFLVENFFLKIWPPKKKKKNFGGSRRQIFFSEIAKSCNFSVKIGDFLKFSTPPEFFMTPQSNFLWPPLTRKSLLTYACSMTYYCHIVNRFFSLCSMKVVVLLPRGLRLDLN